MWCCCYLISKEATELFSRINKQTKDDSHCSFGGRVVGVLYSCFGLLPVSVWNAILRVSTTVSWQQEKTDVQSCSSASERTNQSQPSSNSVHGLKGGHPLKNDPLEEKEEVATVPMGSFDSPEGCAAQINPVPATAVTVEAESTDLKGSKVRTTVAVRDLTLGGTRHWSYRKLHRHSKLRPTPQRTSVSLDEGEKDGTFAEFAASRTSFEADYHQNWRISHESASAPKSSDLYMKRLLNGKTCEHIGFRRSYSERASEGGGSSVPIPTRSESVRVPRQKSPRSSPGYHPTFRKEQDITIPSFQTIKFSDVKSHHYLSPAIASIQYKDSNPYLNWRSEPKRQSSLECGELEDLLEKRRHVEQHRLKLNGASSTPSDDEEPRSKVRYNDMGSIEQVNEDVVELLEHDKLPSISPDEIKVQCRELWHLRASLEECVPIEPEPSADPATSLESPSENHGRDKEAYSGSSHSNSVDSTAEEERTALSGETPLHPASSLSPTTTVASSPTGGQNRTFLLMSSEERRTSFRATLSHRLKQLGGPGRPTISDDNTGSFDSVDTEWSSTTDPSRPEIFTTSLDSTTTDCQTDSTGETCSHRLQQMKADSGYRSLETTAVNKSFQIGKSLCSVESLDIKDTSLIQKELTDRYIECSQELYTELQSRVNDKMPLSLYKNLKSAETLDNLPHSRISVSKESESLDSGASFEGEIVSGDEDSGKQSVLARFLHTHKTHNQSSHYMYRPLQRDYSIDERSDRLFKEFSQLDPSFEGESIGSLRRNRLHSGRRLQRHLEAREPSPRTHRRKLSPQDSIEEEDHEAAGVSEIMFGSIRENAALRNIDSFLSLVLTEEKEQQ